jgi:hypothetical protein
MANFLDTIEGALERIQRISSVATTGGRRPARSTPEPHVAEFSIVDAIDSDTGRPVYIVRNHRGDTAQCSSLAFAQKVMDSLV